MEEVEQICTRIAIMDHGRVIAQGTKEELKQGTFFYFAFGNINEADFQTVPVAVVKEKLLRIRFL